MRMFHALWQLPAEEEVPEPNRLSWKWVLFLAVLAGFLAVLPYIEHRFSSEFQGLTVIRDKDYANYYSRLERVLSGYPEEADNGITPIGSGIHGMQVAGMERIVGWLFGWTRLHAPELSVVVSGLFTVLLFLLFYRFFRVLRFSQKGSLGMTLLYFAIMLHGLSRVMHPGWSFVPTMMAFVAFYHFWQRPTVVWALLAGALLGLLPYLYFWSWTFCWASVGSLVLLSLFAPSPRARLIAHWPQALLAATITLLAALPFFLQTHQLFQDPLYAEVAIRASFLYQRTVESLPRTFLLLLQTLLLLSLFRRFRSQPAYLMCTSLLLGILLAMHQNVLHNKVLMFSSHFYPHLMIATLVAGAWAVVARAPRIRRLLIAGISTIFFLAAVYDYGIAHQFFLPRPSDFRDQFLAPVVHLLQQNGSRDTVLTDATTGRILTSWTDDGIVYTTHTRFLLISDMDMAERFCVSELLSPTVDPYRALYIEYNRVLDSPAMREREKELVNTACARVRKDPTTYLQRYGITHVLWNHREKPEWRMPPSDWHAVEAASGSGWTLWSILR